MKNIVNNVLTKLLKLVLKLQNFKKGQILIKYYNPKLKIKGMIQIFDIQISIKIGNKCLVKLFQSVKMLFKLIDATKA